MTPSQLPVFVVEAFTAGDNDAFTGNTAAICLLKFDDDIKDEIKQKIAMNMNVSETAFVSNGWTNGNEFKSEPGTSRRWTIRWLTPTEEVPLCGHATLASSHVLFHEILKKPKNCETETNIILEGKFRGKLGARMNWTTNLITLDFPANISIPILPSEHNWINPLITNTLGSGFDLSAVEVVHYSPATRMTMIVLCDTRLGSEANETLLKKVKPDFQGMLDVKSDGKLLIGNVIVTIKGSSLEGSTQFYSRFFAPLVGVDEDPVCGSAHTVLVPYWKNHFENDGVKLTNFTAIQLSARGGRLICKQEGDRVYLTGSTRLGLKGQLVVV